MCSGVDLTGGGKWNGTSIKVPTKDADSNLDSTTAVQQLTPPSFASAMATQVNLMTSDNQQFTVDKAVAQRSVLIKNMLEGKSGSYDLPPAGR